ncbi:hypothetical protein KAR91_35200, partial [Candidatus Pacearchaeota archaeon]|nr:hypothetical protein [Candidatus Pacearchaeota archaeon]
MINGKHIRRIGHVSFGIILILAVTQIIPFEMSLVEKISAGSNWIETDWSTTLDYDSLNNINVTSPAGKIKLMLLNVYVTDEENNRIIRTRMDGKGWDSFGSKGAGPNLFDGPLGIDYDQATQYFYIADEDNNRFVKTKFNGISWTSLGTYGSGTNQFSGPSDIQYDSSSGHIYVADKCNSRIVKTNIEGTDWSTYGSFGTEVDQFDWPKQLYFDGFTDDLYIADTDNDRVVQTKFGTGSSWNTLTHSGSLSSPVGISFRPPTGFLYISCDINKVVKAKMDDTTWDEWGDTPSNGNYKNPKGLFVDQSSGYIYICDSGNNRIIKTTSMNNSAIAFGSFGSGVGQFHSPSDVCYDSVGTYASNGYLISIPYDKSADSILKTISWTATTPMSTAVKFQLRSATTEAGLSSESFVGPDGATGTYYNSPNTVIWDEHSEDQWIQYKVYLNTSDISHTPELHDVTIKYNRPPSAIDLQITPVSPDTLDELMASYTYTDSDTDAESGTEIRWYKDTIIQSKYNNKLTISSNATAKGQEWQFTVMPRDGIDFGTLVLSPHVIIGNTPPTKPIGLTPSTGTLNLGEDTTVKASWAQSTDPDNSDTITYNVYGDLNNPNPSTLIVANTTNVSTILTGLIDDGTYYWKVIASDGTNISTSEIVSFLVDKNS